jgi:uncharacterized membrane protein
VEAPPVEQSGFWLKVLEKLSEQERQGSRAIYQLLVAFHHHSKHDAFKARCLAVWITPNITVNVYRWDPSPFILLNLALLFLAAYAAPIIMSLAIRQVRQAERR